MNRIAGIFAAAFLMVASTGCLHHHTRSNCGGGCSSGGCYESTSCSSGACGGCESASCGDSCGGNVGILNKLKHSCGKGSCGTGMCGTGCCGDGCRNGCVAGPLGWQQGGLNYSGHLDPGLLGHGAGNRLNNTPFQPGPPSAQVGYPYYTVRGPRDFLAADPPSIGR